MQQRYLGSKRFSLEGVTALIPSWTNFSKPVRVWAQLNL